MAEKVRSRQFVWLGHVARPPDYHMARRLSFAALPAVRPACGPQFQCKDVAHQHLSAAGHARNWLRLVADRRFCGEEIVNIGVPPPHRKRNLSFVKGIPVLFTVRQT